MKIFLPVILLATLALYSCKKSRETPSPTYAITMSADANGSAEATVSGKAATTATAGTTVNIIATPAANYVFKQWVAVSGSLPAFTTGSATTSSAAFAMPAAAVSIRAEFEPVLYGITISADANGTAAATVGGSAATTAVTGATVTITATPAANYMFKQWVAVSGSLPAFATGSATTSPATFVMPAGTVSIKAEFEPGALINGVKWAMCNVDAFGAFTAKAEDYGMFYQWNRRTAWPATGDVTGWDAIYPTGESWEAANDPCPAGWRVPTRDEQATLLDADKVDNVWTTLNGVTGCRFTDKTSSATIFFPAAGGRNVSVGTLLGAGVTGSYWSGSSDSAVNAWKLHLSSSVAAQYNYDRPWGYPVRCVRQ